MQLKDISFNDPMENLACDAFLLHQADKHGWGECIRFWESPVYFVVLGRSGDVTVDVNVKQLQMDGVSILRRNSGGGTVVQGPGCLNYAFVLSKQRHDDIKDLSRSYRWVSDVIIKSLANQGVQAQFYPISDIATVDGKKFSGNAQHRGKDFILHHGTVLYDFDLNIISKYLHMPLDQPQYRQGRKHVDFVTNISINPQQLKQDILALFGLQMKDHYWDDADYARLGSFIETKANYFLV
jgi:lipoate-protein ligase A